MKIPDEARLTVCSDFGDVARRAAEALVGALDQISAPIYSLALSGGRVAAPFFERIAQLIPKEKIGRLHFFWADERCVPPDDPQSNFALANRHLFEPLAVPPAQIHRIRGEDAPELAAGEAEKEFLEVLGRQQDPPVLDLVLLGMGEDGHVASLFPGEPEAEANSPRIYRPVVASKPPPHRITLGYSGILRARRVWVLVAGEGKANALKTALARDETVPLGRVISRSKSTRLFVEKSLVAGL